MAKKEIKLKRGQEIYGWRIKRIVELSNIHQLFYELEHTKIGAHWVHLSNSDRENVFGVALKTVPVDSTGVPHILEHTVLSGSRKFPIRDPFFSMVKRSIKTYMNAFTYPDRTVYPFASQNKKDFYNLMDVYLDAVFFANLSRLNFLQEGWRLEFNRNGELEYGGVVYNEMKGVMSSPANVLEDSLSNALFPTTTYHYNAGGDPKEIPKLTHERLKIFYRRFYHPSNAWFFSYGNFPLKDHLRFTSEKVMKHFKRISPMTEIIREPRWLKPKNLLYHYFLDKEEDSRKKHQVAIGWLTAPVDDSFEILIMELLSGILLGDAAAPLRKALIDSGLGVDLSDCSGLDTDYREAVFVCGLKGVGGGSAKKIEGIIFHALRELVDGGIDKKLIEAAIHQLEFQNKEVVSGYLPYGLLLSLRYMAGWIHGGDPVKLLNFDADLAKLRLELEKGPFLEERLKRYLLDNPHRVLITLAPDQSMGEREEVRLKKKLSRIKAGLTAAKSADIKWNQENLRVWQNSQEDVSCLPTLQLKDISSGIKTVKAKIAGEGEGEGISCYEQLTNGIFYFDAIMETGSLPERLISLVPIFCRVLPQMGSRQSSYEEMERKMSAYTGGIGLAAEVLSGQAGVSSCLPVVNFSAKCLVRNQGKMFAIIKELLLEFDFSDLARLKNVLLEYEADLERMIIPEGSRFAASLAARGLSRAAAAREMWSGIHHFKALKELTADLSKSILGRLSRDLTDIGRILFRRPNLQIALIGERASLPGALDFVHNIKDILPQSELARMEKEIFSKSAVYKEGWSASSDVSFVADAFKTVAIDHPDAPVLAVASRLLGHNYLHREIREKRGAYGGQAVYDKLYGIFSMYSYRDPNIVSTLDIFRGAGDFLLSGRYSEEDVREAILLECSNIDKPACPYQEAKKSFVRQKIGLTDKQRKEYKKRVLKVTTGGIKRIVKKYFFHNRNDSFAVISSSKFLAIANRELEERNEQKLKLKRI